MKFKSFADAFAYLSKVLNLSNEDYILLDYDNFQNEVFDISIIKIENNNYSISEKNAKISTVKSLILFSVNAQIKNYFKEICKTVNEKNETFAKYSKKCLAINKEGIKVCLKNSEKKIIKEFEFVKL